MEKFCFGSWLKGKVHLSQDVLAAGVKSSGEVALADRKQRLVICAHPNLLVVQDPSPGNGASHHEVVPLQIT